jgi:predicted phage terminase large subunit-like protein
VRAELARRSLAEFIRDGWDILEPGTPLLWGWHLDAICEHLEAVSDGRIKRLLINIPPGHMKSLIVSVFWPAWMWVHRPEWRCLSASYAADLAVRDSVRCRDLITSEWYQDSFKPDWSLKGDQNVKSNFENDRRGFRFSLSVGGRATGFRGDCTIVDDPLNAKEQHSELARAECIFWWDKVMSSRLNDQRTGARVIIMQRLHEMDLSGHVLAKSARSPKNAYVHLCLPTLYEPERLDAGPKQNGIPRVTGIGWSDPRKERGELLFPKLFPPEVVEEIQLDLGDSDFAGQHQQRPAPADGDVFKTLWFVARYAQLPAFKEVWAIWDTALKAAQKNDESACCVAGLGEDGYIYILKILHGRWETPDLTKLLVAQAAELRERYGAVYKGDYVEDKVSGTTLMQYVRRSHPQLALIPIQTGSESKEERAKGVTPLCEALRIRLPDLEHFPEAREWMEALFHQLLAFPNGAHDDIVDTFVYALKRVMGTLGRRKVVVG